MEAWKMNKERGTTGRRNPFDQPNYPERSRTSSQLSGSEARHGLSQKITPSEKGCENSWDL